MKKKGGTKGRPHCGFKRKKSTGEAGEKGKIDATPSSTTCSGRGRRKGKRGRSERKTISAVSWGGKDPLSLPGEEWPRHQKRKGTACKSAKK